VRQHSASRKSTHGPPARRALHRHYNRGVNPEEFLTEERYTVNAKVADDALQADPRADVPGADGRYRRDQGKPWGYSRHASQMWERPATQCWAPFCRSASRRSGSTGAKITRSKRLVAPTQHAAQARWSGRGHLLYRAGPDAKDRQALRGEVRVASGNPLAGLFPGLRRADECCTPHGPPWYVRSSPPKRPPPTATAAVATRADYRELKEKGLPSTANWWPASTAPCANTGASRGPERAWRTTRQYASKRADLPGTCGIGLNQD